MVARISCVSLLLGLSLVAVSARAATFVVDSSGDGPDGNAGNGTCATAPPMPACTLRAAIQEANALAGTDTIHFGIGSGAVTIALGSALPSITSVVVIDGTTQPGFGGTPIVEINAALGGANTLTLSGPGSSGSTIRGLVINRAPGRAIRLLGSSNNVIAGNFLGTNVAGTAALGNQVGVYVGGSIAATDNNRIGGTAATDRNLISGNTADGIQINGGSGGSANNLVQGNYIGVDVTGTLDLGNSNQGIAVFTATGTNTGNVVGGTAAGAGNVISGNNNMGLLIADTGTTGTVVQGNRIGTDAAGTAAIGNGVAGVHFDNPTSGNTIGGTAAGAGNRIAYNGQGGVQLTLTVGTGNAILGNSIHSNALLGIDLRNDGVTPNDLGDADAGPNGLQNAPVLSAAMTLAGNVNVAGSLHSAPSTTYRVEFFATGASFGIDEGERFLGFSNVTTDGNGDAVFGATFAAAVFPSENVTATATDPSNNTSEFSAAAKALGPPIVTTTADVVDGTTTSLASLVAAPGADGRISLREALLATNATGGTDTIRFGIPLTDANHLYYRDDLTPGSLTSVQATTRSEADIADFDPDYPAVPFSWYRIQPGTALPTITGAAVIDGYMQPGAQANTVAAPGASNAILKIELDGQDLPIGGLTINAAGCTIRGLVINRFGQQDPWIGRQGISILSAGGGSVIEGNYVGTDVTGTLRRANSDKGILIQSSPNNVIGGTTPQARNLISGNRNAGLEIFDAGSTGNLVRGNFIGTDRMGSAPLGNWWDPDLQGGDGIRFAGADPSGNTVGGTSAAARNIISGNDGQGTAFWSGVNNLIQGNYVGTDVTGTVAVPNGASTGWGGIGVDGTSNVIGGSAPGAGNLISGNLGSGVEFYSSGHTVQGNFIGTDAAGTAALPNSMHGVNLSSASVSNVKIGGIAAGESNVIASNLGRGVSLSPVVGAENTILGNAIHANGALGIDHGADGVTANDPTDADGGPNDLLNFPFITSVQESGGSLTVYYKLDVPAGSYRIEFFKNPSGADGSGHGEGEVLAAAQTVTHPGGGSQDLSHVFPGAVGDIITATATFCTDGAACTSFSSTSELANAFTAVTTAVKLHSFTAAGEDRSVAISWRTSSELSNLGFYLYRSASATGPYERITEELIPGLGSSPAGASYRHRDAGLENGVTYFYKLEDVESTGRTALHGPVWATPEGAGEERDGSKRRAQGDPGDVSLRVVERERDGALLELVTGGFYATPLSDGTYRLEVPGFDDVGDGEARLSVPVKRTWLEAMAGRAVRIARVRSLEEKSFPGWKPSIQGASEIVARPEGTIRLRRRRGEGPARVPETYPSWAVRVVDTGFQGEVKKALLELAPLRWNEESRRLVWSRRLLVEVRFEGAERTEKSLGGSRGRRSRTEDRTQARTVLARLSASSAGLYRVRFEEVFGSGAQALAADSLRLARLGQPVAYHLEPSGESFGPGSAMYFVSEGARSNPYGNEATYELSWGSGAKRMAVREAPPSTTTVFSYRRRIEREENRYYQAGLLEAPSLWLWDVLLTGSSKTYPFLVTDPVEDRAKLEVWLQGASDFPGSADHRVRVLVNGSPVGEAIWDGKNAKTVEIEMPPGVLREGENELGIENAGDPSVPYSMVFLDRFAVTYTRRSRAEAGALEGRFEASGSVTVGALAEGSLVVETFPEPSWVRGGRSEAQGFSFSVTEGRSYLVASPGAVLSPAVKRAPPMRLRSTAQQADYLVIGPREFLPAAEPLLERRRAQGLVSRAVAVEDLYDEFGYGEARPEAVKDFLEYAYHRWKPPSIRYVLLLGDATYDAKDHLGTGVVNRVPALTRKTSYLWTASDPAYASVNGEDLLPDLALGRLPAGSFPEARRLVAKVLEYEEGRQNLQGAVVLVADDADSAGNFEVDLEEIAAALEGRDVKRIYLRELGAPAAREAVRRSLDQGASLLSYAGHGGIALWASENLFTSSDLQSLGPQLQQPMVMTMNCLNGYFHFPYFDALGEAFVKAEEKGAIAALSPSGLSLNAPAHVYHRALMEELTSGRHGRLGDALLAAQRTYADSGLFPELLSIYHLFGDPALTLR